LLRWTVGLSGQSVTVAGTDGLYIDTDEGRALVFQKGPYLIAIQGPSGSAVPTLVDLAGRLQV
jgi:hypothetical protein